MWAISSKISEMQWYDEFSVTQSVQVHMLPKSDYFGYFFALYMNIYFCIVLIICNIATSIYYDVTELVQPNPFSPSIGIFWNKRTRWMLV